MTRHGGEDCMSSNSVTDNRCNEGDQGTDGDHVTIERPKIDLKGYVDGYSDGSLKFRKAHSSGFQSIDTITNNSLVLDEEYQFENMELDLIEVALQSLQEQSQAHELPPNEAGSADDQIAKLLKKVQVVRAQSGQAASNEELSRSGQLSKVYKQGLMLGNGYSEIGPEELCQVVQAASTAAVMAANAAQAVATSTNRNSRTLEKLCKVMSTSSNSSQLLRSEANLAIDGTHEEEDDEIVGGSSDKERQHSQILDIVSRETEITKSVVRQNKITHWVLGFMIVSSFVWRYGVVKFVKNVNNTIQNPFQSVTDFFYGFKDSAVDNLSAGNENDSSDMKLPRLNFPNILNPDDCQKQKQGKSDDAKHNDRNAYK